MEKICTKCKVAKPLSEFYSHPKAKHNKHPECKPCYLARVKDYRERNKRGSQRKEQGVGAKKQRETHATIQRSATKNIPSSNVAS